MLITNNGVEHKSYHAVLYIDIRYYRHSEMVCGFEPHTILLCDLYLTIKYFFIFNIINRRLHIPLCQSRRRSFCFSCKGSNKKSHVPNQHIRTLPYSLIIIGLLSSTLNDMRCENRIAAQLGAVTPPYYLYNKWRMGHRNTSGRLNQRFYALAIQTTGEKP